MKKINFISLSIILASICFGGFYDFVACGLAVILLVNLLIKYIKNKKIKIEINLAFIVICILNLASIIVCFYAVDKSMAVFGIFRNLAILIFYLNLCQYEKEENQKSLLTVSFTSLGMFLVSIIMYFIEPLRSLVFSDGNRLTGFFQYANTFALFLLLGFIILAFSKKINIKLKIILLTLLFIGILLTGSRITFFLGVINIFILMLTIPNKKYRKYCFLGLLAILLIATIIAFATNNFQNIGRFLTTNITSSSLLGRLVYFKDAIKLIITNPFGLGYMGYSYCYPEVQTAMYSVKFVHNDILQLALDYGIIVALVVFISLVRRILIYLKNYLKYKKESDKLEEKYDSLISFLLLFTILIHCFFEFDFEFMSILFILLLIISINYDHQKSKYIEIKKSFLIVICLPAVLVLNIYFGIASFANYIGNYSLSLNFLPNYTEAKLKRIENNLENNNLNNAKELADEILEQNKYCVEAYLVNVNYFLEKGEDSKVLENLKLAISLDRYNIEEYNNYVFVLSQIINQKIIEEEYDDVDFYIKEVLKVEQMLEDLKNNTSKFAKYFIDKPNFELDEEAKKYIEALKINKIMG